MELRPWVNGCPHPTAVETLEAGRKLNSCVISVLLMAMLFSTPDFNALHILIGSGRFDLREPLIFHRCYNSKTWQLIAVSTLGMALVIYRANYTRAECPFLLTCSLLDASLTSLDGVFVGFQWINNDEWNSFRARGPIAFLFNLIYMFKFLHHPESSTIALIEMLCRVGFEQSSPVNIYYVRSYRFARQAERPTSDVLLSTVLDILVCLVENLYLFVSECDFWQIVHWEYWITRFIKMGLLFPELGSGSLPTLLYALHKDYAGAESKFFRICRQLLSLGFFRQPDLSVDVDLQLSWARRCLYNGIDFTEIPCAICRNGYLITSTEECPVVAPLVCEFLSGQLTLLQLARIEIRRLIGVRHFERRVDSLKQQLPPLCLRYIARADEMLAELPTSP